MPIPRPIKIAISNNSVEGKIGKYEVDKWRVFNGSFENADIMPTEFMRKVVEGYAFTAQHTRYRDSANFICGQHLALDFDSGDFKSSFPFIIDEPFIKNNASFLYSTPSHTDKEPKSRAVFILDKEITDKDLYGEASAALVHKFTGITDKVCKDPARFFYGSKNGKTRWLGNVLTEDVLMNDIVLPYRKHVQDENERLAEQLKNKVLVVANDVPDESLKNHSNSLLRRVREASDGEKYNILRNISVTFGGYSVTGYYNPEEVIQWLKNAIRQNPGNVESYEHADKTIEESVRYGMTKPLYFERNEGRITAEIPELDMVHPPLTVEQKQQITKIVTMREWESYHRALVDKHLDKISYPSYILEHFEIGYKERELDSDTGEIVSSGSITVPFYNEEGVYAIEYRNTDGTFDYNGDVGLYRVKPMLEDTDSGFGIVLPDSLESINLYLSGSGISSVYGLPHTTMTIAPPDTELYCIITNSYDLEQLEYLSKFGAKFMKVRSIEPLIKSMSRQQIERLARQGKPLKNII